MSVWQSENADVLCMCSRFSDKTRIALGICTTVSGLKAIFRTPWTSRIMYIFLVCFFVNFGIICTLRGSGPFNSVERLREINPASGRLWMRERASFMQPFDKTRGTVAHPFPFNFSTFPSQDDLYCSSSFSGMRVIPEAVFPKVLIMKRIFPDPHIFWDGRKKVELLKWREEKYAAVDLESVLSLSLSLRVGKWCLGYWGN